MKTIWRFVLQFTTVLIGILGTFVIGRGDYWCDEWYVIVGCLLASQLIVVPSINFWNDYFKKLIQ